MHHPRSIILVASSAAMLLAVAGPQAHANPADARRWLDQGEHESARDSYRKLGEEASSEARRAAYRLGEGLAAYRAEDFRGARSGYSEALMSPDLRVRQNAHHGLGNALFQLGWSGLAGSSYPATPEAAPDLDDFDGMIRDQLARMLDAPAPDQGEADGFVRIRDAILNWSDAVRHFQSALDLDPGNQAVAENRRTSMIYLKRLQELLEEEREETEQSMPDPSPGQGDPQPNPQEQDDGEPGEPDADDSQENDGDNPSDDANQPNADNQDGDPNDGDANPDEPNDGPESGTSDQPEDSESSESEKPDESPEDRARRILSENADTETGPLNPGRREFLPPPKDW